MPSSAPSLPQSPGFQAHHGCLPRTRANTTHTRAHTHTHTPSPPSRTRTHTHTLTHTYIHMHTPTQTQVHSQALTRTHKTSAKFSKLSVRSAPVQPMLMNN